MKSAIQKFDCFERYFILKMDRMLQSQRNPIQNDFNTEKAFKCSFVKCSDMNVSGINSAINHKYTFL